MIARLWIRSIVQSLNSFKYLTKSLAKLDVEYLESSSEHGKKEVTREISGDFEGAVSPRDAPLD